MRLATVLLYGACVIGSYAHAAEQCGDLANAFGPFDYRYEKGNLPIVETHHFDPEVEALIRGKSGALGGDIDYTLRAFPNHPRALLAMEKLTQRLKTDKPPQANYTIECYYERAIRFRPDDGVVQMLYANYLAKKGQPAEAIKHMEAAEKSLGPNANLHYNMGLVYADLKQYDKALEHAHEAYRLGFNLPGLRAKLERAGKWRDAAPTDTVKTQASATTQSKTTAPRAAAQQAESASATAESTAKP